jgi:hypothetical protein
MSYREVSLIILDKIAAGVGSVIEEYSSKCTIQTIRCENIEDIISKRTETLEKTLHMAWVNKLFENIVNQIHRKVCGLLVDQIKLKKKLKIKENVRCVGELKVGFVKVFENLSQTSSLIDKKMGEIVKILSCELYADVEALIASTNEPIKGIYLKLLDLREDTQEGSALRKIINGQVKQQIPSPEQQQRLSIPDALVR